MEHKIGQTFSDGYEIYEVEKRDGLYSLCYGCCFLFDECCCKLDNAGPCRGNERSDNTDVIFLSIGKVNRKKKKKKKK